VRVRIKAMPVEKEIDGVSLAGMRPGTVREVSALVGSWLIAQGYAAAEMRHQSSDEDRETHPSQDPPSFAHDRRRRS
jgi:hypothetical protein